MAYFYSRLLKCFLDSETLYHSVVVCPVNSFEIQRSFGRWTTTKGEILFPLLVVGIDNAFLIKISHYAPSVESIINFINLYHLSSGDLRVPDYFVWAK
jgi:hypothetical protein